MDIPNTFYRVSIKALILDQTRTKFAAILEENGLWEIPGGGLDWGETPEECIKRELREETGLVVTHVQTHPSYCLVGKNMKGHWSLGLVYETQVQDFTIIPSEECLELKFVSKDTIDPDHDFRTVTELAAQFDPTKHGDQ